MDVVFDLAGMDGARIQPTMRLDMAIGERIDPGLVVVTGWNMKKPSQGASVHIIKFARTASWRRSRWRLTRLTAGQLGALLTGSVRSRPR